ncbi:hypothetical protein [Xanthomonas hortorum]|uniref:Acetyltransferase n=2 Tax=Xanthomonas hortorum TaxID=56454 RepID=A0A6V7BSG5_9XANT|nr:hypothetical protein [Xanthomonas hortorum]ETC90199.1 hypothetical protein XHC_0243 [Xanthomonas hortorum pv. carotae str. M081]WAH64697.1 hypothetical protein OEG85_01455 [Xanthomonas hortorum]CAD0304697.1 hypothetical protein CFBP7900_03190 [Xanthomonas hortorum pv. carotae]CAD0304705.1 hypothetical protein CFBP7900_03190 [Xanthomonas hortorum pv. carotae]
MSPSQVREVQLRDHPALLALNNAHATELSFSRHVQYLEKLL